MPTEIRIYSPSLHTYNGAPADAEMLIVHSSSANNTTTNNNTTSNPNPGLIVSIPIQVASSSGNSNPDLTAVFQAISGVNASTISLNASAPINDNINVNSFIPANPYYVYYGTLPYDSCGGNYYYAAFTDPISALGPLGNLVASNIATVPQSMKTNLQKSKTGPVTGVSSGSADNYVLFQLVGDDESCEATDANSNANDNANAENKTKEQSIGINIICGLLIAIVVMGIAWLFRKWANTDGGAAAPAAPAASAATTPA
jgi:hypothetical protein